MNILITFGQSHTHRINGHTMDKDCVAVIRCATHEEGRALAFEWFDNKFCTSYIEGQEPSGLMSYFPRGKIKVN